MNIKKYNKNKLEHQRITKWLPKAENEKWIKSECERMEKRELDPYICEKKGNVALFNGTL